MFKFIVATIVFLLVIGLVAWLIRKIADFIIGLFVFAGIVMIFISSDASFGILVLLAIGLGIAVPLLTLSLWHFSSMFDGILGENIKPKADQTREAVLNVALKGMNRVNKDQLNLIEGNALRIQRLEKHLNLPAISNKELTENNTSE